MRKTYAEKLRNVLNASIANGRLSEVLNELSAAELEFIAHDWELWARDEQLAPSLIAPCDSPSGSRPQGAALLDEIGATSNALGGQLNESNASGRLVERESEASNKNWRVWLLLGGRGSGKTRAGAEWVRSLALAPDDSPAGNAGYGVKSLDDLHQIIAFFEERRGRLHAFRWRDPMDWKSCAPNASPSALDQTLGNGDGARTTFQLCKSYGSAFAPWARDIKKPVEGTVKLAVAGAARVAGTDFIVDPSTGIVTFLADHVPAVGQSVTAGFEFDVPVRFDTDKLEINLSGFTSGAIPNIPIVEVRL